MRPSNRDVCARLIILKGVVGHAFTTPPPMFSEIYSKWSEKEKGEFEQSSRMQSDTIINSLKEAGAWKYASPKEAKFLQSYYPNIDNQAHIDATWRKECALMLMWALGLRETWPAVDIETEPEILKSIPKLKIGLFSPLPDLRDKAEISAKRDIMEAWHWRVRTRQLIEEGDPFPQDDNMAKIGFHSYDDVVRFSAKNHYQDGDLSEIMDEDFVFQGKPFRTLPDDEYQLATSIISERHFALNWLCGMAPGNRWDDTPTDT